MAEIDQHRRRRFDAISQLIASGCDPRDLPLVAVSHLDGLPPETFDEALARADLVVTARVTRTAFSIDSGDAMPSAESTLAVNVTLKGTASLEVTIFQHGGPMPDDGGIIGHFQGDPILLPGDEVLLLAETRASGEGYWPVYPIGTYYTRSGAIVVPDGNPCDWLNGRSTPEVLRLVEEALSHDSREAEQLCDWSRF